jgi:hypothetical protein
MVPRLEHKAREIEQWAHRHITARQRLAVLIRTLANSTAALTESDFPGNDDSEVPGWDGWTVAGEANPWVPAGKTGWEMGTNEDPRDKPQGDYKKSVAGREAEELAEITFIFVTPRHWPAKGKWVQEKRAERKWKDVRAYDSSDLEQWIAQSIQAQAWLVTELGKPFDGISSLDDEWRNWAHVTTPHLPPTLFESALTSAQPRFLNWLAKPPEKPYVVASDSVGRR